MDTEITKEVTIRKRKSRLLIFIMVLLLLLAGITWLIRSLLSTTLKRSEITVAIAEVGNVENTLNATGEVLPEFEEVIAIENKGLLECIHGRNGSSRQVLVMDVETLEEFGIASGRARENITTHGIALEKLSLGQRLRAGEALLEVTQPCTPCHQMDEIRDGLQNALRGRRGILCRVVEGGAICRGDRIELQSADSIHRPIDNDAATGNL